MKHPQYTTIKYLPNSLEGVDAQRIIRFFNLIVIGNLKIVIIMANVKLIFHGTEKSKTEENTLVAYSNIYNEIYLCIDNQNYPESHICLDKLTAVRLVRELKKQIGNLESEVNNG